MAMMKFKNSNGEWMSIPAFKGEPGKDGAVQYKAGDGIKIENDTITAEVTKDYLDGKLEELAEIGFTPEISESLPTENIDENTIYMIPAQDGKGDNIYEEWMYINNKWEMIGSTSVDLSNYYTKDEVEQYVSEHSSDIDTSALQENLLIHPIYYTIPGSNPYWVNVGSELETLLINKINELYKSGKTIFIISIIHNSDPSIRFNCLVKITTVGQNKTVKLTALPNFIYDSNGLVTRRCFGNYSYGGGYTYNSTDDVFKHKATSGTAFALFNYANDGGAYVQPSSVLTKNNATSFTPSADYHPATKKYVDDSIVESNIVDLDISGFKSNMFEMSGSGTGYASSNEHVKAALEKIARLGEANCVILIHNPYGAALCSFTSHYNHSNGGFGAYYTGIYQEQASGSNGVKYSVTIMYSSDGSPANIKVQSDTLEGYITPNNVLAKTNTKAFTPTANYHPATKKYVDDAVANIPQGSGDTKGFYTYKVDLGNIGFAGEIDDYGWITHMVTDKCKTEINDLINKMLTDDIGQPLVVIENTNAEADLKSMLLFGFDCNYDPDTMQSLDFTLHGVANYIGSATGSQMMKYENAVMFAGSGIVTDGVWDATALAIAVTTQQSLTTDNQMEYVPTGDYNPATKKYVDDAVANAGGGSSYPIYHTYIPLSMASASKSVTYYPDHNTKICSRLADIFTDMKANAYQIAEILNDAYSLNYNITFRKPLRTSSNVVYLRAVEYDFSTNKLSYADVDASYTLADNVYTVTQVTVKPNSNTIATKAYVDDAVAGASGGITSESDPVFKASEAYKITSTDTANWNSKVDINAVNNAINTTLSGKSYLTSESDPTVPSWAKQPNKPKYTASEVGALPASTVIPTVPTKLSGFTDDLGTSPKHSHSQYLTAHQDISGKQNKVLYGTVDPTSDVGAEGDIYIKYV